jgi:hypothetical protein
MRPCCGQHQRVSLEVTGTDSCGDPDDDRSQERAGHQADMCGAVASAWSNAITRSYVDTHHRLHPGRGQGMAVASPHDPILNTQPD